MATTAGTQTADLTQPVLKRETATATQTLAAGQTPVENPPDAYGNLGFLEGRAFLENMVKTNHDVMQSVRVDLKSFLARHGDARLPTGGASLPAGGGIPKFGYKIPGGRVKAADDDDKKGGGYGAGGGASASASSSPSETITTSTNATATSPGGDVLVAEPQQQA